MNNITTILGNEKFRLERKVKALTQRLLEISKNELFEAVRYESWTKDEVKKNINLDCFTPEKVKEFDFYSKKLEEAKARLFVFKSFLRKLSQQTNPQIPGLDLMSLEEYSQQSKYKNIIIPCNTIEIDEKSGNFKYGIIVGHVVVKSKEKMTFDEYKQLYTSALGTILIKSLKDSPHQEEILKQVQDACKEIYSDEGKKKTLSL